MLNCRLRAKQNKDILEIACFMFHVFYLLITLYFLTFFLTVKSFQLFHSNIRRLTRPFSESPDLLKTTTTTIINADERASFFSFLFFLFFILVWFNSFPAVFICWPSVVCVLTSHVAEMTVSQTGQSFVWHPLID